MDLPDNVEMIFMDDGSDPPLTGATGRMKIYPTNDKRPWSEHVARNAGAKIAQGEYLFMIDADYIIPKETIETVLNFTGDKMNFKRRFATLNEHGEIDISKKTLKSWGLTGSWLRRHYAPRHRSQYVMSKVAFNRIGGYKENLAGKAYPQGGGAGQRFYRKWQRAEADGKFKTSEEAPEIFMYPIGKYCGSTNHNPFNLFHNLKR